MNESQKAQAYGELLNEHTRLRNKISEIEGQSIELNQEQLKKIDVFKNRQIQIMEEIKKLFN